MTEREALKLALEALKTCNWVDDGGYGHAEYNHVSTSKAITAIKEALAPQNEVRGLSQPEQRSVSEHLEPVFWWNGGTQLATQKSKEWDKRTGGTTAFGCDIPLYTTPPQRTWVGLTDEDKAELDEKYGDDTLAHLDAIEAKLKEKNT